MPPAQPAVPNPSEELAALLTNPLLLAFGALFAAWLASRVVQWQVESIGLDRTADLDPTDEAEFAWSRLFAALAFWGILTLGLLGITAHRELTVVATFLKGALELILRGALAAAVLAAAASFGRVLTDGARGPEADPASRERARRERHTILLVGGVLAVAAATGLSVGTWLLLAAIGVPAVLLLKNAKYRERAAAGLSDLAAGLRLRGQYRRGSTIAAGARELTLVSDVGPLKTWVREGGAKRLLQNQALYDLAVGAEASPAAAAASEGTAAAGPATEGDEA